MSNILPLNYSAIHTNSINNDFVKREYPKARTIEMYKRDIKQVISLGKLKYRNLALKKFIQDNSDSVFVNNIFTYLGSY